MKKITRRAFIASSAATAATLGITAGCNSRKIIGPDIRSPSAPTGLEVAVEWSDNGEKRALLTWNEHNLTDITGAPSENAITGYRVYRNGTALTTPTVPAPQYTDTDNLEDGQTYTYQISAIDQNGNESPLSKPIPATVTWPSLIYKATSPTASAGLKLNSAVITFMVHNAVRALSGKATVAEAFESLFPSLSDQTTIGIKINCLASNGLCTHPEVVNAIIAGLSQMRNATFPLKNITVYDDRMESFMRNAGFTIQNNPDDYKIISTYQKTDAFWGNTVHIVHGVQQRLSRITEEADYIINVPVLKDHSNAGITFALKNSYGMVDAPGTMHDNWCDPYIAALYAVIASKVRLIVGDAIFGVYKGGPATGPNCMPNTILVGTDPVAIDMYALTMINTERTNRGMYAISTSQDPANPSRADARHLLTAASSDYNLGSINKKIFEVVL